MSREKKGGKGNRVNEKEVAPSDSSHPNSNEPPCTFWVRIVKVVKRNRPEIKTLLFRLVESAFIVAVQQFMMA